MKILFGMKLDGARWTDERASLDSVTYGPMGMLSWLEKYMAIDGIDTPQPERINQYLEKIKAADSPWCRKSFNLDSWSTAKEMLSWRDELILNGWNREDSPSARLEALSLIEKTPLPLSPGIPDRLEKVISEASSFNFDISLETVDDIDNLPYLWKEVLRGLLERGAEIKEYVSSPPCKPLITTVTGENEFTLARECARYLSSGDNSSIAIIAEGETYVLDGLLHRYGFGSIGNTVPSKWRESLQILPLWLKTLWKPFNVTEFMELLKLPVSPIPALLRNNLSFALQKAPGYGGEEWNEAWKKTESEIRAKYPEDPDERLRKVEEMRNILDHHSFYAGEKVSEEDVIERCSIFIKYLSSYIISYPEVKIPLSHAKMLVELVSGKGEVTEIEIERMLESIIGTGTAGDGDSAEYTEFDVCTNPGMIMKNYDTVIWWNCVSPPGGALVNWTQREVGVLKDYKRSAVREIDSASWHNAPRHAEKNLICFIPKVLNGSSSFPHPLLDEYDEKDVNRLTASSLVDDSGLWHLLDRNIELEEREFFAPFISNRFDFSSFKPERLSYSSLSDLIACPVKWMLRYHIALTQADTMSVPTGNQVIGTLAHKIVENIYKGRDALTEEEAEILAGEEYDTLLPQMAAELMSQGSEVEERRTRKLLVSSVRNLVREINSHHLKICSNEMRLSGEFEGVPFSGYSDIVLEDRDGNKFVIDMKWSFGKHYREHYENDEALQLAVYSWLLDEGKNVSSAYYIFPRKDFVYEDGKDWLTLMERARNSYKRRLADLNEGYLFKGCEATLEDSPDILKVDTKCEYCDYKDFCDVLEGKNE